MASRLATILEKEYKSKGLIAGLASATGKRALEKLDIRNALFSGSGIGSILGKKIFGKGYSATRKEDSKDISTPAEKVSTLSSEMNSTVLESINTSSRISAKNSIVLPSMARDMFLVKQNLIKLVKLQGGTPQTKAGDWFNRQQTRENTFESKFGKTSPTKVSVEKEKENNSFLATLLAAFGTIFSTVSSLVSSAVKIVLDLMTSIGTLITEFRLARGVSTAGDILGQIPDVPGKGKTVPKTGGKLGGLRGRGGVIGTMALGGAALATGADVSVTKEDVALPGLDTVKKHFGGYFDMANKDSSDKKAQRLNRFATEGETITQERAMDYFVNKGLTPEQAAGIVGNLMQESRLKSDAYNAKEGAYGIAQWRNDRLEGLKQFAASQGKEISDINTQMDYILLELGTTQKQAGQMLLASKTPQEAAFNFGKYYERPKTVEHTRIAYAEQAYSKRNKDWSLTTSVPTAKSTGDLINQSSFDNNIKKSLGKGEEVVVINNNSQTNNNQQTSGGGSTASPWNENAYKIFAERSIGF